MAYGLGATIALAPATPLARVPIVVPRPTSPFLYPAKPITFSFPVLRPTTSTPVVKPVALPVTTTPVLKPSVDTILKPIPSTTTALAPVSSSSPTFSVGGSSPTVLPSIDSGAVEVGTLPATPSAKSLLPLMLIGLGIVLLSQRKQRR